MKMYTLPLSHPSAHLETVGGKGISLAKLANAGLPVPDGFHITTQAYCEFVNANHLQTEINQALQYGDSSHPSTLETASASIRDIFEQAEIPVDLANAIVSAYAALPGSNAPVAVRSSATAEDLPDASFAGQQETYLNITGADQVLQAAKKCWASLWTARAIGYRARQGIGANGIALAVVVQLLVNAEAAGIMFTANPINGKRDEIVINAAWGLGEAVVGGVVTPDTLTVDKQKGRVIRREIAEKLVMTVRAEEGTFEVPVPDAQKKKEVLSDLKAMELARLGMKIEELYGMPMDVEWTYSKGIFSIVQARPITSLPPEWKLPPVKAVFARGSLAEHIPNPVTPLFATVGLEIANQATAELWARVIGKNSDQLHSGKGFYVAFNGYVYGGFRTDAKGMWAITRVSLSQLLPIFRGSVARWQAARQELATIVDAWEKKPIESLSPSELLDGMRTVFLAACRYFTVIQTTLPAASMSEVIFTRFYNKLIKGEDDPEHTVFLIGSETFALQAEKSLFDIATWIKNNPALVEYMIHTPTDHLLADFKQETSPRSLSADLWDEWRRVFQLHMNNFGRTAYEFDFANPTPTETPAPLLDALKAFLTGKANNPYQRQHEAIEKREQATQSILKRIGWPRRGWFEKLLRWAQETGQMRENSIFDMGMGHPTIRRIFAKLGRLLVAEGAIDSIDEIYWLEKSELEELVSALEDKTPLPHFAGRVPSRKEQWQSYRNITAPVMLPEKTGWNKFVHGNETEQKDGKTILKGVGTSSGTVTAPARVLLGPEDFDRMQPGDVLVATTTTPAWTPLFAMASAVVTDIGGPLSHSSIVAREYGIPAVMAARNATHYIRNGQVVTVNGGAGTVTLENN